ncbi:hypothetical protein E8E11_001768 [Didymella keratinophila]|nr:hypothetical protein E8E11_001768 [Didymella keratinophila]
MSTEPFYEKMPLRMSTLARSSGTVAIIQNGVTHHIYRELLTEYAPRLLRLAKNATDTEIVLPGEYTYAPETLDIFVDWLDTQQVRQDDDSWFSYYPNLEQVSSVAVVKVKAYNLGHCFSKAYQQVMLEVLVQYYRTARPTKKVIDYAFKHLLADDPVLDLLSDAYCYHPVKSGHIVTDAKLPQRFLARALDKLAVHMKSIGPKEVDGKGYQLGEIED